MHSYWDWGVVSEVKAKEQHAKVDASFRYSKQHTN